MRYLGYVEAASVVYAASVVLPDFPGCFSAVDNEQDLNAAVQEAVELHFDGEDFDLPTPLMLSEVQNLSNFDYQGAWMWFEIDTDKISTKLQRVNITIPTNILTKLDLLAGNQHTSRSGMVRQLVEKF
ncbi:type II toxin-antitoxin system HicB family antitoxin [Candidatus Thioglobus sp.]|uniref:type II toxin-antitoxin system HicB family antitoxin n=1 Tax=Candidatus Thioglobus sp. TaxID=2026721 RepID=UPI003D0F444D